MTTNQALVGPTDHNHVLGGPESSGSEVKHLLYSQGPKTVGGNKQRLPPGESTFLRLRLKPKDKSSRAGAKNRQIKHVWEVPRSSVQRWQLGRPNYKGLRVQFSGRI